MPKALKQKNNERITDNYLVDIKPEFPPTLTKHDLIKNALRTPSTNDTYVRPKTLPNAYIAYRMALVKEYRNKNLKFPPMGQFSKIAKKAWDKESQNVKDFY